MSEVASLPTGMDQENRDLGFGSVLSREQKLRLLNRDGTFNVYRRRKSTLRSLFTYHGLLSMPAPVFVVLVAAVYLMLNVIFAEAYILCGPGALQGISAPHPFWQAFFFSVHTFATIGYESVHAEEKSLPERVRGRYSLERAHFRNHRLRERS